MATVAVPSRRVRPPGHPVLIGAVALTVALVSVAAGLLVAGWGAVVPGSTHDIDLTFSNRALMVEKLLAALLFAVAAWYLTTRRTGSRLGPLVMLGAVANAVAVLAGQWAARTALEGPAAGGTSVAVWLGSLALAVEPTVVVGLYLLFPDGARARGRLGAVSLVAVVLCALGALGSAVSVPDVDPSGPFAGARNPVAIPFAGALGMAIPVGVLLGNLALVLRWWTCRNADRRRYRALSVVAMTGFGLPLLPVGLVAGQVLYEAHTLLLLLVVMATALRDRVFGVEVVLNRTLVYSLLTGLTAGAYVTLVAGLALAGTTGGPATLSATIVAAFILLPARQVAQRLVNRFLYGRRDEPYAVLASVASRLEAARSPEASLVGLLAAVVEALQVPGAVLELADPDGTVERIVWGSESGTADRFPLVHQGLPVGALVVVRRSGQPALTPNEADLLGQIARQAAVAAHLVALTRQLQRSREKVVGVAEEERRRLRRDLHDGLGPVLTAAASRVDACVELLGRDEAKVRELLGDVRGEITGALDDLRRVVYALRPPVLDELGLLGAVREHVRRSDVPVALVAPDVLPPLPAAVEIAAYRIIGEAVANVSRHARATSCTATLTVTDHLVVEVKDDGTGTPAWRPGVGLSSMRERVTELGGLWAAGPSSTGGLVRAELPLTLFGVAP